MMTEEPLGIAILSTAHIAHASMYTHALMNLPNIEVLGVYDEDPSRGRAFAQRFGGLTFYEEVEPLLERKDVRAVVVCSPTDTHAALVTAAARAGKHILCEKPIATTLSDARLMIASCAETDVQLHIPFVSRFYPMVQAVQTMIASNELGPVCAMVGGNRGRPPLPPAYPSWITNVEQAGGGALIDHSVHVSDVMRFITGAEVASVSAEVGTLLHKGLKVDDSALLLLRFKNDMVGSIDPSWSIPAANPYHYDFYLRILAAEGTLSLDDTRQGLQVSSDAVTGRGTFLEPFGMNIDGRMVEHFIRCIRQDEFLPPAASGEDGLRALEIALAAYESARLGEPVAVSVEG